jgi:hypothetical protein
MLIRFNASTQPPAMVGTAQTRGVMRQSQQYCAKRKAWLRPEIEKGVNAPR